MTVPATRFDSTMIGAATRPAVIVVGVWDPLVPEHQALFSQMADHAHRCGCDAVTVLLDPPPVQFLPGRGIQPSFELVDVRAERMQQLGIDAVIVLHFTEQHLNTPSEAFFAAIAEHVVISELWLGAEQVFGRGASGSQRAVYRVAGAVGFTVRLLDAEGRPKVKPWQVRMRLASGCVAAARELVGYAPILQQPAAGTPLRVAWSPGTYEAYPLHALSEAMTAASPVSLDLVESTDGYSVVLWPDRTVPYMAVVRGPHDLPVDIPPVVDQSGGTIRQEMALFV